MDLLWRFLLGGALVCAFSVIGDVLRPRRFAGLFGAAPSIALATLALTIHHSGALVASTEARSMTLTGLGFVLYASVVQRALAGARWPAIVVSLAALAVWGIAALLAGLLLTSHGSLD